MLLYLYLADAACTLFTLCLIRVFFESTRITKIAIIIKVTVDPIAAAAVDKFT